MRTRISIKLPRANPCLGRSISSCASCPAFHARRCSWVPIHGPSIRIHLRCFDVAFMDPTDPNSGSPVPTADFFQFLEHLRTMFDRLQPALALTKRAVNNRHTDSKFGDLLGLWRWLFLPCGRASCPGSNVRGNEHSFMIIHAYPTVFHTSETLEDVGSA